MASDGVIYPFDVIRGLRDIVAEFGPDTTRSCTYVKADYDYETGVAIRYVEPRCIVGVFLNREGVSLEELASHEGDNFSMIAGELPLIFDENAVRILQRAQEIQDSGSPWGEALSYAEGIYEDGIRGH